MHLHEKVLIPKFHNTKRMIRKLGTFFLTAILTIGSVSAETAGIRTYSWEDYFIYALGLVFIIVGAAIVIYSLD